MKKILVILLGLVVMGCASAPEPVSQEPVDIEVDLVYEREFVESHVSVFARQLGMQRAGQVMAAGSTAEMNLGMAHRLYARQEETDATCSEGSLRRDGRRGEERL